MCRLQKAAHLDHRKLRSPGWSAHGVHGCGRLGSTSKPKRISLGRFFKIGTPSPVVIYKRFQGRDLGAARALCILLKGTWVLGDGGVGGGVWRGGSRELVPSPVGGERV